MHFYEWLGRLVLQVLVMLAEIKNIIAEEKVLLNRLAEINYPPPVSDFIDTSECDQGESR